MARRPISRPELPTPETKLTISVVSGSDPENIAGFLSSVRRVLERVTPAELVCIINWPDASLTPERLFESGATQVLARDTPLGFAANHNEALRRWPAQYHVIANDDIVASPQAIEDLMRALESDGNERVGVISPQLRNPDGSVQPSTYSFPSVLSTVLGITGVRHLLGMGVLARALVTIARRKPGASRFWDHDRPMDVDTVRGAFVMVRGACVSAVGPMDEVSLVGGEETEWHYRMHRGGWRVHFFPAVGVIHQGSATVRGRRDLPAEYLKGTLNYFVKHRPRLARILGALVLMRALTSTGFAFARRDGRAARAWVGAAKEACCVCLCRTMSANAGTRHWPADTRS